jgi:hypothetical protein
VNKEHIEDLLLRLSACHNVPNEYPHRQTHRELNNCLVRSRTKAVQYLDSHPGPGTVKASEPDASRAAEYCRDEEHKSSANDVCNGNPPDIDEPL